MNAVQFTQNSIQKYGEYTAFQYQDQTWTNIKHDNYASRLATVLLEKGVKAGDRIPVVMSNCPEVLACFQAIWKIGAVITPTTPQLGAREIAYILQHSDAKIVITLPPLIDKIAQAKTLAPNCKTIYTIGPIESGPVTATDLAPEIQAAKPYPDIIQCKPNDMAFLLYTSGTTGHPKGVMLTHNNIITNHLAVAKFKRLKEQSQTALMLPLSHSFGVLMMNLCSIFGCSAAIMPNFDPQELLRLIQQYKITRFSVVPTMLVRLINTPQYKNYDTTTLEIVNSGGAILPNQVRQQFEKKFNCKILDGYGLSECAPTATSYPSTETIRPGSIGKPIPGVTVTIQDETGTELPPNTPGEICIQGPNVMKGYWKNPEATKQALQGGHLHSGDIGHKDQDGYIYLTDRIKDLIIKGGENISPREIEDAFYTHPAIQEVTVVGIPDPTYGENIIAIISLKIDHTPTEKELLDHIAQQITKFKIPTRIEFRQELPKNPNGKIDRKKLRSQLAEQA
jgi:long-chain acyl-CoA synthetase